MGTVSAGTLSCSMVSGVVEELAADIKKSW